MNYTLDRFPTREDRPVLEAFDGLQRLAVATTKLERLLTKLGKKAHDSRQAKKAMQTVLTMASRLETGEPQEQDLLGKLMGKVLEMVGKKLIKAIVRPILNFAARMAMNLVRIAARAVLRWAIIPIFEAVATAATALLTPEILIGLGIAAAVAGGVALYRKYFSKPEVEEVEVTPTGAVVGELPELVQPKPQNALERTIAVVTESSAVKAIEKAFAPQKIYKAKAGDKFTGFGTEVDTYVREASTMFPALPLDVLRGFIKMEAGWTGKMSPTGAIGTGQFVASTWNALIGKGGAALGMQPITGIYGEEKDKKGRPIKPHVKPNSKGNFRTEKDPRFDKRINTLATALLASKNAELLKKAGLPITGANLYMLHNIGPGIIPVMKGHDASPATLLAMRQNGMRASMSAQDFLEFQKANYQRAYASANSGTAVLADQPQIAKSITVEPQRKASQAAPAKGPTPILASTNVPTGLIKGPGKTLVGLQ